MNGRRAVAFRQPAGKPRFLARPTCAGFAGLLGLFITWTARAPQQHTQSQITTTPKQAPLKRESWRTTPTLPGSTPKQPRAKRLEDLHPDQRPSRERILFPWECEPTDLEWAAINVLAHSHPEAYEHLLQAALEHSGLLNSGIKRNNEEEPSE